MSKIDTKTENAIIVDGVVLTKKAVTQLIQFQENDNDFIKDTNRIIADAICEIIKFSDDYREDDRPRINALLQDLTIVRQNINELQKP